jgi:hypothetical protein
MLEQKHSIYWSGDSLVLILCDPLYESDLVQIFNRMRKRHKNSLPSNYKTLSQLFFSVFGCFACPVFNSDENYINYKVSSMFSKTHYNSFVFWIIWCVFLAILVEP